MMFYYNYLPQRIVHKVGAIILLIKIHLLINLMTMLYTSYFFFAPEQISKRPLRIEAVAY